jgi:hypothetical protein
MNLPPHPQRMKKNRSQMDTITLYHATPLKINAIDIIRRGLDPKGEIYIGRNEHGDKGVTITHKEYLTKDTWLAMKQACVQPKSFSVSWEEFIAHEPYGYIFVFEISDDKVKMEKGLHTIDENIYPTKAYKIKKPDTKFLESMDEYADYFRKNAVPIKIKQI